MWNDFDSSSLASFFLYKLGIFFIIAKSSHIDRNSFHWIQTIWPVSLQFCHHASIETSNLFYQIPFAPNTLCNHISALYIILDSSSFIHLSFVAFSVILQMVRFRWADFNFKPFLVINNTLVILQIYHTLESLTKFCSAMFVSNILLRLFSFLSSFHSCCTKIHYNRYAILASDRHRNSFLCFPGIVEQCIIFILDQGSRVI